MTINKSQGQTFNKIGVYLPNLVFTNGQLYVALSRVGSREGVKIMVTNGWKEATFLNKHSSNHMIPVGVYTDNVVYKEVLE